MNQIIITCEHGGNEIPKAYKKYFIPYQVRLDSHEGWDIGALFLAKKFSDKFSDYFFYTTISRLLVELNRSCRHPNLFSDITKPLDKKIKESLLAHYYFPYRYRVTETIQNILKSGGSVLHLSVHSFTPFFRGKNRLVDVGLLYDPGNHQEKKFSMLWQKKILEAGDSIVRCNYPYLGKSDGFVTSLRKQFHGQAYMGIELEVNQKFAQKNFSKKITDTLLQTFSETLHSFLKKEPI